MDQGYIDIFRNETGQTVLVAVTHFHSHDDAREALVGHLMKSTCPRLPLGSERGLSVGNVSVTGVGSNPLLNIAFVRDHTFVWVRSIGDRPYDVRRFAEIIDASIAES